jgi:hypothetical protein
LSGKIKLTYFGWSSFDIQSGDGSLLFDPLYRKLFGWTCSSLDDFRNSRVICVTHGHFDHYVDVPRLLRETKAVVVGSDQICQHLRAKDKDNSDRLLRIAPFQEINIGTLRISAFEWGHREVRLTTFLKKGFFRAEFFPTLQLMWLNLFKVPFNAPYYGYYVKGADGIGVMNYCEGFSDAMNLKNVVELGQRFKTDVLIAGMQLNFEKQLSEGIAAISPKTVVLFHPHNVMFERLGLKSSSTQTFIERIKGKLPSVRIIVAEPRSSYTVP